MTLLSSLHRTFARLHGGIGNEVRPGIANLEQHADLQAAYAEYAAATAHASEMLQQHGPASPQFARADVTSMRLFHRVKKMQGLRKPREN